MHLIWTLLKKKHKHKHFGRDSVWDKRGLSQDCPWDNRPFPVWIPQWHRHHHFVLLCLWDGWGFVPETIVQGGTSAEWILHERFFSSHKFSYVSPKCLSLCSVGQKKNPGKFPPNFPLNFPKFPAKNQKKFTDELLQERRENDCPARAVRKASGGGVQNGIFRTLKCTFGVSSGVPGLCRGTGWLQSLSFHHFRDFRRFRERRPACKP